LRWFIAAAVVLGIVAVVAGWMLGKPCDRYGDAVWPGTVEIHAKLRVGTARDATLAQSGLHIEPLFTQLSATTVDDRARWIRIVATTTRTGDDVVRDVMKDPNIEQAFVAPEITLAHPGPLGHEHGPRNGGGHGLNRLTPSNDAERCPVTTPSFESYQGYLGAAPDGIDAPAAWQQGYRGAGVWFADIEGGWNAEHEDLPGDRMTHVGGTEIRDPMWSAHGTAVLGQVVGRDNGKGVVGIAPDVERVFTSSIGGTSVADAIDVAASRLRPGDVLLIELQGLGPRNRYVPVEYWDDVYDAIRAATSRGVVVIEAAGNGNANLDNAAYDRKFDRNHRDSGAIMVGAGAPPREGFRDRERLEFSNYGARVDVQGWGRKVATLAYGDLQSCSGTERHYTGEFSGTSSASPIVAGAAVILEGIARSRGSVLTPAQLRDLLRATGTPQAGDTSQPIGPRPDLARAIQAL
ncbi:MAG: S8 family peptidase, partial [Kofleriaceae bacterium]